MDKHVDELKAELAATITRVKTDPKFIYQGRAIAYLASKMIYAAGHHARFLNVTPYFSLRSTPSAPTKKTKAPKPQGPDSFIP
jgi:hypothetical protein